MTFYWLNNYLLSSYLQIAFQGSVAFPKDMGANSRAVTNNMIITKDWMTVIKPSVTQPMNLAERDLISLGIVRKGGAGFRVFFFFCFIED